MNDDQYKVLVDRIDTLQKSVDRMDRDLGSDRKDIQEYSIRLGGVESQVEELRKAVKQLPEKTQDRVEDVMQPITDTLDQVKKLSFWKRYIRR